MAGRARTVAIILVFWLLSASVAALAATPYVRFPIVLAPYDQPSGCGNVGPWVCGDRVVWVEGNGLYGYDLGMGRRIALATDVGAGWGGIQLSGNRMFWTGDGFGADWWPWHWRNQFIYDMGTQREYPVSSLIALANPAFAGNTIVGSAPRPTLDIYAYNLTTGQTSSVCAAPKNQDYPATDGKTVVWMDSRNDPDVESWKWDRWDLYGFNLETREEFPICLHQDRGPQSNWVGPNYGYGFMHPQVSGDNVVWMAFTGSANSNDVRGFRISTGEEFKMNGATGYNMYPQVSGHTAVWNWRVCPRYPPPLPYGDIHGFDMLSGKQLIVSATDGVEWAPDIWGNTIVWYDTSNLYGWFPSDNDVWAEVADPRFVPPADSASDPSAFQPYIAGITTHPTQPMLGEPYSVVVRVRNHGGRAGTATVSLRESKVSPEGDGAHPVPYTDSKPLAPYGDAIFEFRNLAHLWSLSPSGYDEFMAQAAELLPADALRRYAEVTYADDRDRLMDNAMYRLRPLVQEGGQYRYDLLLEPASQAQFQHVTVMAPRYQKAALLQAIAAYEGAGLFSWAAWKDPQAEAYAADAAIWFWLSRQCYDVARGEKVDFASIPDGAAPDYPELTALPDSLAKRAALDSLAYSGPASAVATNWLQVMWARQLGEPNRYLNDQISRKAEAACSFAEQAQAAVCMVERDHSLSPLPPPKGDDLATFRASLLGDGLPDLTIAFLRARGWTDENLTALTKGLAEVPDATFSIPRVSCDAAIVQEGSVRTAVEEANRIMDVVRPEDNRADTGIVLVGVPTRDGKYIDEMQVRLNYLPEPGVSREYRMGVWDSWHPYTGPVTIQGNAPVEWETRGAEGEWPRSRVIMKREPIFTDVPPSYWASRQIESAYFGGIVTGFDDGRFLPDLVVTRDQVATYLARFATGGDGFIPTGPATPSFPDVPPDHWAYRYVEYVKAQGVVTGYEDGLYHPERSVDRSQMAVYVARILAGGDAAVPPAPDYQSFPDVVPALWARKYIEYLWKRGVVIGYEDGLYHPDYILRRDQLSVFIQRAFGLPLQGG